MLRLTATALCAAFLGGCAGYPPAPGTAAPPRVGTGTFLGPGGGPEVSYVCEDLTTIVIRPWEHAAVATLNSGLELRLAQQPYGPGNRFGDRNYDFRSSGNTGLWTVPQRSPVPCRLKR